MLCTSFGQIFESYAQLSEIKYNFAVVRTSHKLYALSKVTLKRLKQFNKHSIQKVETFSFEISRTKSQR